MTTNLGPSRAPRRNLRSAGLLLAALTTLPVWIAGCGGANFIAEREAEGRAAFADGKARHDRFVALKTANVLGPTESHLLSWHAQKSSEIKEMYEATRPLRFSGLHREGFRNALNESAMHAHLADLMEAAIVARGGPETQRDAVHAAESSAWEAMRAAREVIVYVEADPSQAQTPEAIEAGKTFEALQAKWTAVRYEPGRNYVPADGG